MVTLIVYSVTHCHRLYIPAPVCLWGTALSARAVALLILHWLLSARRVWTARRNAVTPPNRVLTR